MTDYSPTRAARLTGIGNAVSPHVIAEEVAPMIKACATLGG